MGTGSRSHHEKEGVLDLAVKPDNSSQTAKYFALTAFSQDRRIATALGRE
jgi:hypothetical protein